MNKGPFVTPTMLDNIRRQHGAAIARMSAEEIATAYEAFYYSDISGNNDERFVEHCSLMGYDVDFYKDTPAPAVEAIDPGPPWNKKTVEDETNYANHPLSITEIRSDKTNSGRDWTPRDALISALRDIDSGVKSPSACVICFGEYEPNSGNAMTPSYYQSTQSRYEFFGILEAVKLRMAIENP